MHGFHLWATLPINIFFFQIFPTSFVKSEIIIPKQLSGTLSAQKLLIFIECKQTGLTVGNKNMSSSTYLCFTKKKLDLKY